MNEFNDISVLSFQSWMVLNEARTYDNRGFSFDDIKKVQAFLVNNGFMNNTRTNGKPAIDGMLGVETSKAMSDFQRSKGFPKIGDLNDQTLKSMGLDIVARERNTVRSEIIHEMPYGEGIRYGVERNMSRIADVGGDRAQIIDPSIAKVVFAENFKRLTANQWIERGYKNFTNLTFFEANGTPTSNFYANGLNLGAKIGTFGKYWPMMVIKPKLEIVDTAASIVPPQEAFSGSQVILRDGNPVNFKQTPEEASMGRRTAVGITMNDDIIVMVSTRSSVKTMATKMQAIGARDVINMDGGGSPLFVRDGKMLISSARAIPTILAW